MFTCKRCKHWETCTDKNKSSRTKDGDSWAYWCDDFESKVPTYQVETDRYIVSQSDRNFHTMIFDKELDRCVFHSQTTKPLSKKKLLEEIDFYLVMREISKKLIEKDEREANND